MCQEWQALIENHTFDIVAKGNTVHTRMTDRIVEKPIGCKWIYKRKINPDGSTWYKARLVIKGDEQKEGIDYDETYVPVSKMATFRLILVLATQYDWDIDHMDVVTACYTLNILSTSEGWESASTTAEKDKLGGHHTDKQSEGNGNVRSCESRSRNRSGVVSFFFFFFFFFNL